MFNEVVEKTIQNNISSSKISEDKKKENIDDINEPINLYENSDKKLNPDCKIRGEDMSLEKLEKDRKILFLSKERSETIFKNYHKFRKEHPYIAKLVDFIRKNFSYFDIKLKEKTENNNKCLN